jgi:hypothetical protein
MVDFVSVYDNLLSIDECYSFVNYIDQIENNSLLFPDQGNERAHRINQKAINFSQHYDLTAWTWIGDKFFPVIQECVNDYMETYSVLLRGKFLIYDVKTKKIPAGGGGGKALHGLDSARRIDKLLVCALVRWAGVV